jgi:hypothetical protein
MPVHGSKRQCRAALGAGMVWAILLAAGCAPLEKPADYMEPTGNHESPHPHRPELGLSEPERADEEPIRVLNDRERARMEEYIAEHVEPEDVVATIQLSKDELVDCVRLDRQPSLRRPALQGDAVRMEPPAGPREEPKETSPTLVDDPSGPIRVENTRLAYGAESRVCPERTIPVRRLTIEILDNFETLEDFLRARPPHALTGPTDQHQYAYSYILVDSWGAQSTLNVWSPYTERASEFSLSQIAVTRGAGSDKETVESGWQKYRDLYGDYRPRLFIYFTPDNYGSGGCYNLTCSAFVQVNNSVYIGGGFTNISTHPHPSTAWEFTIRWQRHGETGDWWLKYGDTWVGYYPSRLFDDDGLRPHGSKASFYGEIIDDEPERHTRTDMGSGHFPADGFGYAAYQRRIRTISTSNVWNVYPSLSETRTDANCYDIDIRESSGDWERYVYFGGPGYGTHCQ